VVIDILFLRIFHLKIEHNWSMTPSTLLGNKTPL